MRVYVQALFFLILQKQPGFEMDAFFESKHLPDKRTYRLLKGDMKFGWLRS